MNRIFGTALITVVAFSVLYFICLFLVVVVFLANANSRVLETVRSLIASSYLDKSFTNDAWEMELVTTLQNEYLEQQYM